MLITLPFLANTVNHWDRTARKSWAYQTFKWIFSDTLYE